MALLLFAVLEMLEVPPETLDVPVADPPPVAEEPPGDPPPLPVTLGDDSPEQAATRELNMMRPVRMKFDGRVGMVILSGEWTPGTLRAIATLGSTIVDCPTELSFVQSRDDAATLAVDQFIGHTPIRFP